jgi:hypothetical protein
VNCGVPLPCVIGERTEGFAGLDADLPGGRLDATVGSPSRFRFPFGVGKSYTSGREQEGNGLPCPGTVSCGDVM